MCDRPTKRPQYMRISWLITVTYLHIVFSVWQAAKPRTAPDPFVLQYMVAAIRTTILFWVRTAFQNSSFRFQHVFMYLFDRRLRGQFWEFLYLVPRPVCCFQGISSHRIALTILVLSSVLSMVAPTWYHGPAWREPKMGEG